jgi:putative protein-disulfide isomerase
MTAPRQLIYFADPMCSWCWGFSPVIAAVERTWGGRAPVRLVMGGLRPGTTTPMSDAAREDLRGHWRQVTEASGQRFGAAALSTPGFVYDTDPAARAVVIVRRLAPDRALAYLHRVQQAFYVEGEDVTDAAVLAALAAPFGVDPDGFAAAMTSEATKQETWRDYALSQNAGVTGFPTLILGPRADGAYVAITRGYNAQALVEAAIAEQMATMTA